MLCLGRRHQVLDTRGSSQLVRHPGAPGRRLRIGVRPNGRNTAFWNTRRLTGQSHLGVPAPIPKLATLLTQTDFSREHSVWRPHRTWATHATRPHTQCQVRRKCEWHPLPIPGWVISNWTALPPPARVDKKSCTTMTTILTSADHGHPKISTSGLVIVTHSRKSIEQRRVRVRPGGRAAISAT
jgi:hypothetical protein